MKRTTIDVGAAALRLDSETSTEAAGTSDQGPASHRRRKVRLDGAGDRDGGLDTLDELIAAVSDQACPIERLTLAERFVRLATASGTSIEVRERALRAVQDLSRRKAEERACSRGLEVMRERASAKKSPASRG